MVTLHELFTPRATIGLVIGVVAVIVGLVALKSKRK